MRKFIARYRRVRRTGQEGWALMDAIWSSVVVALAFMGTFLAIDASTRTATNDVRKSTAYDLAQNELDHLRKLGDTKLTDLLQQENNVPPPNSPNRTVTLDGVVYSIWNRAYYVQDIGTDITDACGYNAAAAGDKAAQFVYIKTTVTWPAPSSTNTTPTASLDSYFAPEGGDLQSNTATLRVFVLDRLGAAIVGQSVDLNKGLPLYPVTVGSKTSGATGCVLFTGLARGDYQIQIPRPSHFNVYMTTAPVKVPITIPGAAMLSRSIKISEQVTVKPVFETNPGPTGPTSNPGPTGPTSNSGPSGPTSVAPSPTGATGPTATSALVGPWIANSTDIPAPSGTEFVTGISFMPHVSPLITDMMFPLQNGYSAYAGPCAVNDPGVTNFVGMPFPASDTSWAPASTYTPGALKLKLPNFRVRLSGTGAQPGTGKILVRLVGGVGGAPAVIGNCGTRELTFFNTWIRLPGTVANSGYLTAFAYALPTGSYDICVRQQGAGGTWGSLKYRYQSPRDNTWPGPTWPPDQDLRNSGTTTPPANCPASSSTLWN